MLKEFKEFAMRGSVMDMAIGIIIGAAFGTIVKSLVDDVLMPPIGVFLGGIDTTNWFVVLRPGAAAGPYATLADAKAAGAVTINHGVFLNALISFLLVLIAVFFIVRSINALRRRERAAAPPPATKECQYCTAAIPVRATRCPQCTSQLAA